MDYYIQGDAANADKIKAAFEKLGYKTRKFDFRVGVFYTYGKELHYAISDDIANIIKTHPDYKELELPVEPKFNVGDWIVATGKCVYLITKIDEFTVILVDVMGDKYEFGADLLNDATLWTVNDAKDGDVLVTTKIRNCPFIYRKTGYDNDLAYYYAGVDGNGDFCEGCIKRALYHFGPVANVAPATKEQRDLLFAKMREAGYEWDEKKKELKKVNV